ncbi:hypothetical protein HanRHA438_Chr15g0728781 [Helianthus annuus]|nr:hypothetical protein HanHA300_Chr15g0584291 [Helianthus annuus]KAJ0474818.1 hypothetical protein HanHA89_Chr15g0634081 [Helianthus annuus]KAJ0650373.1 hypothetical protein HanLR1_Chr15g0595001 [Helianthus annuus]KAJ0654141.1 hypothetical protein HanOQP8_Chr15g0591571 [Helianthus annuus]KAJ0846780.1 hypothetical protein HanRHA438_Chr15g0728781 [Helianthus annuus]
MPPQRRLKARIDCPSPKSIAPPSQPSPPPPFAVQPPDLRLGFQGSEENPEPEIQKCVYRFGVELRGAGFDFDVIS